MLSEMKLLTAENTGKHPLNYYFKIGRDSTTL